MAAQPAEYLVVIEVLNRPRGRDRRRIYHALRDRSNDEIDAAIENLEQAGVVAVRGRTVVASAALQRLESLNLIGL